MKSASNHNVIKSLHSKRMADNTSTNDHNARPPFFIGCESVVSGTYEYCTACCGRVTFRTNGPQGGDAGHGGFLQITFDAMRSSTHLDVEVNGQKIEIADYVTLTFRGDCEIYAASECFKFLAMQVPHFLVTAESG